MELTWLGPYRWYGEGNDVLFRRSEAEGYGVYVWTVPISGNHTVFYVGECGARKGRIGNFLYRHFEHTTSYLSGIYKIYDPELFSRGDKKLLWPGMWQVRTQDRVLEFLARHQELVPRAVELMGLFRIFLGPMNESDRRLRHRIEAGLALCLRGQTGLLGSFQDPTIRYLPRRPDEIPIELLLRFPEPIAGVPERIEV